MSFVAVSILGGAALAGNIGGGIMAGKANKKAAKQAAAQAAADRAENARQFGLTQQLERDQMAQQGSQFGQTLADKQQMDAARRQAFQNSLSAGGQQMAGGEAQLMEETQAGLSPELQQMQSDIQAGTTQDIARGTGEMQANLAQQGVRGGQAATQLRRGVGEMRAAGMEGTNRMAFEDASNKKAIRTAYMQNKALTGQRAALSPATF
jgi:hypothetical protein